MNQARDGIEPSGEVRRVAAISVHTSPLAQPGTGDAGGMNVYVNQTARRLAARGVQVEIFTRATSSDLPPVVELVPGVLVRHIVAGPFEGLDKNDLPGQLCSFAAGVMRAEARREMGYYDLIHSHYWLSGQVGYLAKDRWAVPQVHSAHTLARVKNLSMAQGDSPEPAGRVFGEDQVVAEADRLIANADAEAEELIRHYGADPARIDVVSPGVDTDIFVPGDKVAARHRFGFAADELVITFVGRIQPLKAPDVLLKAAAVLVSQYPDRQWRIVIVGGVSGTGRAAPDALADLSVCLGIADRVRFMAPMNPADLVQIYRASDAVAVPSYNESFGLVALEAQASGTPVVAAAVGGLTVAVKDGVSGILVNGHDAGEWATALASVVLDKPRQAQLAVGASPHASQFSWEATVDGLMASYRRAILGLVPAGSR